MTSRPLQLGAMLPSSMCTFWRHGSEVPESLSIWQEAYSAFKRTYTLLKGTDVQSRVFSKKRSEGKLPFGNQGKFPLDRVWPYTGRVPPCLPFWDAHRVSLVASPSPRFSMEESSFWRRAKTEGLPEAGLQGWEAGCGLVEKEADC